VGKAGERQLGRPRRKWVDNIKMVLREIEWVSMYCSLNGKFTNLRKHLYTDMDLRFRTVVIMKSSIFWNVMTCRLLLDILYTAYTR
jgi:hypothetical protein